MSTSTEGREAVTVLSYQERVKPWLDACFGPQIAIDKVERNHRFIEEALELVQSTGCTKSEAHQLVDYVYSRDIGDPDQEVGGVMNTLAALCLAHGLDMHEAGERELARVNQPHILEKIRAKQKAKPKHSPLPEAAPSPAVPAPAGEAVREAQTEREARYAATVAKFKEEASTDTDPASVLAFIEQWTADTFPVDEQGQVHLGRAMLEMAADALRVTLATPAPDADGLREALRRIAETRWDTGALDAVLTMIQADARAALTPPAESAPSGEAAPLNGSHPLVDKYCEGFCEEGGCGKFEDCMGCEFASALEAIQREKDAWKTAACAEAELGKAAVTRLEARIAELQASLANAAEDERDRLYGYGLENDFTGYTIGFLRSQGAMLPAARAAIRAARSADHG